MGAIVIGIFSDFLPSFAGRVVARTRMSTSKQDRGNRRKTDADETKRASEELYRILFDTLPQGVVHQDADGKIISMNPAAERILGKTKTELLGQTSVSVEHDSLREDGTPFPGAEHPSMVALRTGKPVQNVIMEVYNPREKAYRWIKISAVPLFGPSQKRPYQVYTLFEDISERKNMEGDSDRLLVAVQKEKDRLSSLVNSMSDEVWFTDTNRKFILANPSAVEEFGLDPSAGDIDVKEFASNLEVLRPDGSPRPIEDNPALRALDGEVVRIEEEVVRIPRTGELRYRQVSATPVKDADGNIIGSVSVARDITSQKMSEGELRNTRDFLENLFDYANAPIIVWDPSFKITRFNHAFERLTGRTANEVIGRDLSILFPPDTKEESLIRINDTLSGKYWESVEIPILRKDGLTRIALWNSANIYQDNGKTLVATIAQGQDITGQKMAEENLRSTRDFLENLFDHANAPIIVWDPSFKITRFNHAFERLTGRLADEVIGKDLSILFPSDTKEESLVKISDTLSGEYWETVEIPILRKDGSTRIALWNSANIYEDDGKTLVATIAQGHDITDRKEMEDALAEEKDKLKTILDSLPVAISMADAGGRTVLRNKRVDEVLGYAVPASSSIADFGVHSVYHPGTDTPIEPEEMPMARALKKGEVIINEEMEWERPNGTRIPIIVSCVPIRDEIGTIVWGLCAFIDITKQKEMERDLARSNTELQSFAYAASHDLREPLRTISGFLELLEMDYGGNLDDKAKDYIRRAVSASMRLHEMIDDLLSFSRLETRKKAFEKVDLNGVYEGALHDLGRAIKEHNASITSGKLPTVFADDTQIAIVLRNLIDNAIKFHKKDPPTIQVTAQRSGDEWLFSVKDNGIGIDPMNFPKVFNMFTRLHSRKEYPGTGIGLAMCKKIIERHGGRIWVESEVGKGSTFFFTLPDYDAISQRLSSIESRAQTGKD